MFVETAERLLTQADATILRIVVSIYYNIRTDKILLDKICLNTGYAY